MLYIKRIYLPGIPDYATKTIYKVNIIDQGSEGVYFRVPSKDIKHHSSLK